MAANKKSKTKSKKAQQKAVINGAAIKGEDLIHISPARVSVVDEHASFKCGAHHLLYHRS